MSTRLSIGKSVRHATAKPGSKHPAQPDPWPADFALATGGVVLKQEITTNFIFAFAAGIRQRGLILWSANDARKMNARSVWLLRVVAGLALLGVVLLAPGYISLPVFAFALFGLAKLIRSLNSVFRTRPGFWRATLTLGVVMLLLGGCPWVYTPYFFGGRPENEGAGMLGTIIFLFIGLPGLVITAACIFKPRKPPSRRRESDAGSARCSSGQPLREGNHDQLESK